MHEFYKEITDKLKKIFVKDKNLIAVWEGGSAATGYLDKYSDLDLGVIAKDNEIENSFTKVEDFLEATYGIKHKFRMPEPNWHGHSQCFYILNSGPNMFYVDLLIEKESASNRFLESDRHGKAVIWFDRKDLIDQTPTPQEETAKKCRKQYQLIKNYMPFTFLDIEKQIIRENIIDAVAIYNGMLSRFTTLLNIKYRPAKHDFGLRYLYRDFPQEQVKFIEEMIQIPNLEKLAINLDKIKEEFQTLCLELDDKYND